MTGWIPGRPERNAGIGSMLHFGGTLTLNGAISYMAVNFDKFAVGRDLGRERAWPAIAWHRS